MESVRFVTRVLLQIKLLNHDLTVNDPSSRANWQDWDRKPEGNWQVLQKRIRLKKWNLWFKAVKACFIWETWDKRVSN